MSNQIEELCGIVENRHNLSSEALIHQAARCMKWKMEFREFPQSLEEDTDVYITTCLLGPYKAVSYPQYSLRVNDPRHFESESHQKYISKCLQDAREDCANMILAQIRLDYTETTDEGIQGHVFVNEENRGPMVEIDAADDSAIVPGTENRDSEFILCNANDFETESQFPRTPANLPSGDTSDNETLEAGSQSPTTAFSNSTMDGESALTSRFAVANLRDVDDHQDSTKLAQLSSILENGYNSRPEIVVDQVARCMDWWTQYDVMKTTNWQGYPMHVVICILGLFSSESSFENTPEVNSFTSRFQHKIGSDRFLILLQRAQEESAKKILDLIREKVRFVTKNYQRQASSRGDVRNSTTTNISNNMTGMIFENGLQYGGLGGRYTEPVVGSSTRRIRCVKELLSSPDIFDRVAGDANYRESTQASGRNPEPIANHPYVTDFKIGLSTSMNQSHLPHSDVHNQSESFQAIEPRENGHVSGHAVETPAYNFGTATELLYPQIPVSSMAGNANDREPTPTSGRNPEPVANRPYVTDSRTGLSNSAAPGHLAYNDAYDQNESFQTGGWGSGGPMIYRLNDGSYSLVRPPTDITSCENDHVSEHAAETTAYSIGTTTELLCPRIPVSSMTRDANNRESTPTRGRDSVPMADRSNENGSTMGPSSCSDANGVPEPTTTGQHFLRRDQFVPVYPSAYAWPSQPNRLAVPIPQFVYSSVSPPCYNSHHPVDPFGRPILGKPFYFNSPA